MNIKQELFDKEIVRYSNFLEIRKESDEASPYYDPFYIFSILEIDINEVLLEKKGDEIDWFQLSHIPNFFEKVSPEFVKKFSNDIPWNTICKYGMKIPSQFIVDFKDKIDWSDNTDQILMNNFTENQLRELEPCLKDLTLPINFSNSVNKLISDEFILEFKDKIDFSRYWNYGRHSIKFLLEIKEDINWENFSQFTDLTEEYLDAFAGYLDWNILFKTYIFSERIINKFSKDIINHKLKETLMIKKRMLDENPFDPELQRL